MSRFSELGGNPYPSLRVRGEPHVWGTPYRGAPGEPQSNRLPLYDFSDFSYFFRLSWEASCCSWSFSSVLELVLVEKVGRVEKVEKVGEEVRESRRNVEKGLGQK